MLEIKFIEKNTKLVKENLKKRFQEDKILLIDEILKFYDHFKTLKKQLDFLRHKRNLLSKEINQLKKRKVDLKKKLREAKKLPKEIKNLEQKVKSIQEQLKKNLMKIPNILHKSVPIGKNETQNKIIKKWGVIRKFGFKLKSHGELLEELKQADFKKAADVSGTGFVFLKDKIALLDLALQRFAIDYLLKKGFLLVYPPLTLRKKITAGVTDLEAFKDTIYKIENEDLYLIPTSEFPLIGMFSNEILKEKELPIKIVGYSPNFRKELGSHGIDTKGLFRMHQFNKVEQVVICKPKDSWKLFEEMQKYSEELMQKLRLPYRVVSICSGELGLKQSKQLDIEAYFPREKKYKEVTSCSNCTLYQAANLNIRYINNKGKREYVHILNNTALATSRIMRAIIENYQKKDGSIKIPNVLQKYMNDLKLIK